VKDTASLGCQHNRVTGAHSKGREEGERREEGMRGEGVWGVRARGQFVAHMQNPARESTPGVDTASWVGRVAQYE